MTTTETGLFSFLKTTDVYDPDRLAADLELIRRYYLRKGYADFQVVGTNVVFDPQREGYVIDIAVQEGQQYRVGAVSVDSRIADVSTDELRRRVLTREGQVYDATAVERTLVDLTTEVARRGYAFAQVRPAGEARPRRRRGQHHLHRRGGPARLHRADQQSAATRAPATTSSVASSISAKATPTTRC